jgi:tRNA pseudouridine synthase 10
MFNLKEIQYFAPFCLSCLGRVVGKIGFGLDNRERGIEVLNQLEIQEGVSLEDSLISDDSDCKICDGLISEIPNFVALVSNTMSEYSIYSFKIGTIVDKDLLSRESDFQLVFGENIGESIKSQLNRETGIGVWKNTAIEAKIESPDAVAIIDTSYDTIELEIKSLFIEGNYNKFDRTVPQTRWPCSRCKGMGCRKCDNTGQLYPDSVQSLIANSFSRESLCTEDLFHGMGREDIDAAMLGDGRPFVLELRMPKVRDLNLEGLEKEINEANKNRIKVINLRFVDRPRVAELKNTVCDKSYRVDISVSDITSIESLKKGSQRLTGTVIEQRTPTRVSHRRADLVRPRLINRVDVVSFEGNMAELVIRAQHGTYIRELVSGDEGRTVPSLSSLIDANCKVEVLDVLNLHLEAKEEKND